MAGAVAGRFNPVFARAFGGSAARAPTAFATRAFAPVFAFTGVFPWPAALTFRTAEPLFSGLCAARFFVGAVRDFAAPRALAFALRVLELRDFFVAMDLRGNGQQFSKRETLKKAKFPGKRAGARVLCPALHHQPKSLLAC